MKAARAPQSQDLQVPMLERGLAILEWLTARPEGATLSQIADSLDIALTSAFRIAKALQQLGFVRRDEKTRRYAPTGKMLRLGQPHNIGRSLTEACIEPMRRIRDLTGETTQLCCLADGMTVILEQLPSVHPFKYIVDLGSRIPAHCCAPGKAILAFIDPVDRQRQFQHMDFSSHTDRTITDPARFEVELQLVKDNGIAVDRGEHFVGVHCVAAPMLDRLGHPVAAITIAGPSTRLPVKCFAEIGRIVRHWTDQAAARFGA